MERHFHYRDSKGLLQTEVLSAEQGATDERVLRTFSFLETTAGSGATLTNEICKSRIAEIKDDINTLPENRALHWVAELERIGAIAKAPKAKAEEKPKSQESTGGAK